MRLTGRIAAACALALAISTAADAQTTGTIRGRLLDAATEQTYDNVEVTLTWTQEGKTERRVQRTQNGGRYAFTGLPVQLELSFTLSAEVDGELVERSGVALSEWTPEMTYDLKRVAATSDRADLATRLVIAIHDSGDRSSWRLAEFITIENKGAENYVHADADGRRIPLRLETPARAAELSGERQEGGSGASTPLLTDERDALLNDPLPPGQTLITYSYSLSAQPPLNLSRTLHLPMDEILVLIENPNGRVLSDGFESTGSQTIGEALFQRFELKNAPAGQSIPIQVELPSLSAQLMIMLRAAEKDGFVEAVEFLHVQNNGTEDFAETDHDGVPIGLHIHLPEGARDVQAGGAGGQSIETRVDETGVSVVNPIPPGTTTIELAYLMPVGSPMDLSRSFHMPVREIRAGLENLRAWIVSPFFIMQGSELIHGDGSGAPPMRINLFTRRNIRFGRSVPIRVEFFGGADSGSKGVPIFLAVLMGALALTVGGAVGSWISQSRALNRKTTEEPAPPPRRPTEGLKRFKAGDLAVMKRMLLEYIAELDAQREQNALTGAAHRQMRDEAKARLARVIEQQEAT
ncbi:MAG: carboxypeptidase-like regulatory domain-containing protein [Candidatus Poribacteria bacterium]|nr:carboxypeptidase-like regulatory domain-containing protein [Candidatus Poribacteria bacterium]